MIIVPHILVVEDDDSNRRKLAQVLEKAGYNCTVAASGGEAMEKLGKESFNAVLCDLIMPDIDGLSLLQEIKKQYPQIVFILITGHGSVETAITAMKRGAYDYLTKPIEIKRLKILLEKALEQQQITIENMELKSQLKKARHDLSLIGNSAVMHKIYQVIQQVAPTPATVLIQGESGTGKEVAANAIQSLSERKDAPFIKVNCGALGLGVLESELFGHEKGAFTGAIRTREGRFKLADGGTIFLDEIGEADLKTQVKLLRILEEQKFERVGGEKTLSVDVRVIAATNQDLKQMVAEKKFREDLYYRLKVVSLYMPALRDHREDIPLLIASFVNKFNEVYRKQVEGFSKTALNGLYAYSWPGNVRELKNVIESMVVMTNKKVLDFDDLPPEVCQFQQKQEKLSLNVGCSMAEVEKMVISKTLEYTGGDREKTAAILGLGSRTIYRKINEYGLRKIRDLS